MSRMSRALLLSTALAILACADVTAATDKSAPAHDSASATEQLQEVTVTAPRAKLANRVSAFVSKITGPLFEGGLTRWGKPVCPLVSGLRHEAVTFILGRVGDVARAAGVPFADGKCRPNLYILVSGRPRELLRAMDSHHRWFTFGNDAHAGVVSEFISLPGPVRILYRDAPTFRCPSYPYVSSSKVGPITMAGDNWYFDSHSPAYKIVWYVFRAFVIVDASQLKGVTLGQFADYVGMVGLAQIRPSDSLADAPTILKLFGGAPQTVPARMTDWDRAFLKSLYTTNQSLHGQRWHVAQAMMNEIAH